MIRAAQQLILVGLLVGLGLSGGSLPAKAAPPRLPLAEIDDSLEIEGEATKGNLRNTRMRLPVEVEGAGPFRFVIDSGADKSVVSTRLAERLQLPAAGHAILLGVTGTERVPMVSVSSLRIGSNEKVALRLPALKAEDIGAHGLIGIDALQGRRLQLDFEKVTATLQSSRAPQPRAAPDEIIVTARRRYGQLILARIRVEGIPVLAVIDTGTEVTIGNLALLQRLSRQSERTVVIKGVTGTLREANMVTVSRFRIADVELTPVEMAFLDVAPFKHLQLDGQPAVLLGNDVLQAFGKVTMDFGRRKVRFQKRSRQAGNRD
ncbi:aspartyl protease family protein [Sphingomonas sp. LHG3406-1]|uniref:aspartyl protease family protein n=1 Tax=Sphingomonas sp. LHG3406-1 TaxID=2804617 RepID=UPI002633694B|nr:aspartyl protease family protein [Sphingomonas sp. LHG3406-1]